MKLLIILGAFFVFFPANVQAKMLVKCSVRQTPQHQLNCGRINVRHGHSHLKFLKRNREAGTIESRYELRKDAKYLIRYGKYHIQRAVSRMQPAHYYGWLCIHNREGNWNDEGS